LTVTLKNTTQIVEVNGVKMRVWEGSTDSGIAVQALIPRIAALKTDDLSQFDRELTECAVPSAAVRAFPARLIL